MAFLHGVEVTEINTGPRVIRAQRSSVIGIVGTAPDADTVKFPLNTPVLIAGSRAEASALGATGTLPSSIDAIFDQIGTVIVVIRVEEDQDSAITQANVIGSVDVNGQQTGLQALIGAETTVHATPKILIAPGFTHALAVTTEMETIAERLRAVVIADGPNTNDADAITYRGLFGSRRVVIVDPWVQYFNQTSAATEYQPMSAYAAGVWAKSDLERGVWYSPSNRLINGITGLQRQIDWSLGDVNSRANLLNADEVCTAIHQDGYRLWGDRTCSSDPKYAFINVVRTNDMIMESIKQAHLWAVDQNITKTYLEDVVDSVNAFMRQLKTRGAILGGKCWVDPELNTAADITAGHVTFDYDFTPVYPAERITFRSRIVDDYIQELFL